VDFKGIKRSVSFEKGDEVLKLLHLVMIAFSDVGLNEVPPSSLELLKYREGVEGHVRLPLGMKLYGDTQIKMDHFSRQNKGNSQEPELYHPVKKHTPYRLWNLATAFLLQRDSSNKISCNGNFKDMDYNTVATTTKGSRTSGFGFLFKDKVASRTYILNATNGGKDLVAVDYTGKEELSMKFKPSYYWSFTVFRNKHYRTLYLGCGNDGESLLLPMNSTRYPDPRVLFITNKYVLDSLI